MDTSEENDSREKLEADVRKWCGKYAYQADMVWAWLNRQAAITRKTEQAEWIKQANGLIHEANARADEWQLKCCEEAGLHASHVFQRDELIRDMYESMCAVSETWAYDSYAERMRELGIEVDDD